MAEHFLLGAALEVPSEALLHPRKYVREMQHILLAFGKPVAKNDARVIRRRLPPLSPLTHEVRGGPILSRTFLKNRLCLLNQFPSPLLCKQAFNEWQRIFFCSTSRAPSSFTLLTSPPRSYVREMQPILQRRSKLFSKIGYTSFTSRYTPTRKQAFCRCIACCEIDIYLFL